MCWRSQPFIRSAQPSLPCAAPSLPRCDIPLTPLLCVASPQHRRRYCSTQPVPVPHELREEAQQTSVGVRNGHLGKKQRVSGFSTVNANMNLPGTKPTDSDDPIEAREREFLAAIRDCDDESPLEISVKERQGIPVVKVDGELEIFSSELPQQEMQRQLEMQPPQLLADLSGTVYIDSTGLGVLPRASRECEGHIGVIVPKDRIARLFKVAGLTQTMALYRSLPEAIDAVKAQI